MNSPLKILLMVLTVCVAAPADEPSAGLADDPAPTRLGGTVLSFGQLLREEPAGEILLIAGQDPVDPIPADDRGFELLPEGAAVERPELNEQAQRDASIRRRIAALKKPVDSIAVRFIPEGLTPENRAAEWTRDQPTILIAALGIAPPLPDRYTVFWTHRPLYYEQPNLERCGNACGCWQNPISAAQFLWHTALLPYQLGRLHPGCPVQAGGDCLSYQRIPLDCELCPPSCRGLTVQAAALAGFAFLLL